MTAEIVIMNRSAVALAADSAVTIEQEQGQKIFNSVNKLFTLSKYHPVGVMIYGNAVFMNVPWESIIKIYRSELGKRKYSTLIEYADNFISFLSGNNSLFPEKEQEKCFFTSINGYFNIIRSEIDKKVKGKIDTDKKIVETAIKEIVEKTIKKHFDMWNKVARLGHISSDYETSLLNKYMSQIIKAKEAVFQQLPISEKSNEELQTICASIFSRDIFPRNFSGLVIAGFGDSEIFPSLISFKIDARVNNELKYKKENEATTGFDSRASIIPFAQSEMVVTFMEGIDPAYRKIISDYLSEYFEKFPDYIVGSIENADEVKKQEFAKNLKEIGRTIISDFETKLSDFSIKNNISPIINAVSFLPKDELAGMAESLVNLTSFKRKISLDAETIGGPIDVAVISKGDGFIWIKRKHYFKPELNSGFFATYYRGHEGEQDHEKKD